MLHRIGPGMWVLQHTNMLEGDTQIHVNRPRDAVGLMPLNRHLNRHLNGTQAHKHSTPRQQGAMDMHLGGVNTKYHASRPRDAMGLSESAPQPTHSLCLCPLLQDAITRCRRSHALEPPLEHDSSTA